MLTLVIGGSASGKSAFAERLAVQSGLPRFYVATMRVWDAESERRVARHRDMRREKQFDTLECPIGLDRLILPARGTALLEDMGNLVANELYDADGAGRDAAETAVRGVERLHRQCAHLIVVSNEVFRGGADYAGDTARYLLELARVDNGGQNMVFSRLNFSELVSDALLPFEPVYFEKGLTLESNVEENLFVRGSQQHLKQVADILLDNASKYASADSTVRVILRRQGSHCLLSVASAGDAISKEDLKNIFKRFYRMDKARSMNHSYGLGLSIARSLTELQGGEFRLTVDGDLFKAEVTLPQAN